MTDQSWFPLPTCVRAVAKASYSSSSHPLALPLRLGDIVYVFEGSTEYQPYWYRGYLLSPSSIASYSDSQPTRVHVGIFPASVLSLTEPIDVKQIAVTKIAPKLPVSTIHLTPEAPILSEIAAALQEWCPSHLYSLFKTSQNYPTIAILSTLIEDLCNTRKQLILNTLTSAERDDAVKTSVWNLVRGNKLLSGEVIVRNEKTGAIDTGNSDLVKLYRDQEIMALATHSQAVSKHTKTASSEYRQLVHLLVNLQSAPWKDKMEIKVYLCSKQNVVTESISMYKDNDKEFGTKGLFADISPDASKDDLFMVVEVYEQVLMKTPVTNSEQTRPGQNQTKRLAKGRRGVALGVVDIGRVLREKSETGRDVTVRVFTSIPQFALDSNREVKGGWGTIRDRLVKGEGNGLERTSKIDKVMFSLRAFEAPNSTMLTAGIPSLMSDLSGIAMPLFTTSSAICRDQIYVLLSGVTFKNEILRASSPFYVSLTSKSGVLKFESAADRSTDSWNSCVVTRDERISEIVKVSPLRRGEEIVFSIHGSDGNVIGMSKLPLWVDDIILKDGQRNIRMTDSQAIEVAILDISSTLVSSELSSDQTLVNLARWRTARTGEGGERNLLVTLKQIMFVNENELAKLLQEVLDSIFGIISWKKGDVTFEDHCLYALAHVLNVISDKKFNVKVLDQYIRDHFNYPVALAPLLYGFQRLISNHKVSDIGVHIREALKAGRYIFRFITASWEKYQSRDFISIELGNFSKHLRYLFEQISRIVEDNADLTLTSDSSTITVNQMLAMQNHASYLPELRPMFSDQQILDILIEFMESSSAITNEKLIVQRLVLLQSYSKLWIFSASERQIRQNLATHTVEWLKPYLSAADLQLHLISLAKFNAWKERIRLSCSILAQQFRVLWSIRKIEPETCGAYVRLLPDVAAVFVSLQESHRRMVGSVRFKNEYSLLFPESYPFPMPKPVDSSVKKTPFDETLIELTLPLAVLSEFSTYDNGSNAAGGENLTEQQAIELMTNVMKMCTAVLDGKAFPKTWLSIYMFQHRAVLHCMEFIALILLEYFVPRDEGGRSAVEFRAGIWRLFFNTVIRVATSDALEIEIFTEQKRRMVWEVAGDVREVAASLLRKTWNAIGKLATKKISERYGVKTLGGFQSIYGASQWCGENSLVGVIVEAWISCHKGLRIEAAKILQAMLIKEWNTRKDLAAIQIDIIDSLDRLFNTKAVLKSSSFIKNDLLESLRSLFSDNQEDTLSKKVHKMLDAISSLLDLLIELHTLPEGDAYNDDRILCTLNLMTFLKDLHREHTFIRYVHQLIHMQELSGHYAEAGLTLGLHAKMYEWRRDVIVPALTDPEFPEQSAFERRETLQNQMAKYFILGHAPELALTVQRELAEVYENVSFELEKLVRATNAIAKIYKDVLDNSALSTKPQPQYFKVSYLGLGFHKSLRGKQFIVQGSRWEKLVEFTDRMENLYPDAKVLASTLLTNSSRHTSSLSALEAAGGIDADGQYLHITAVNPEPSLQLLAANVPTHIQSFFLARNLKRFSVSRPLQSSSVKNNVGNNNNNNALADLWVEKTIYTTTDAFPTILRRSEIAHAEKFTISPTSNAADSVGKKSTEVLQMAKRAAAAGLSDGGNASAQLSMVLSGAVDAPVNGGIRMYKQLLVLEQGQEQDVDSSNDITESGVDLVAQDRERLQSAIINYVAVLRYALKIHARVVAVALRPLHDNMVSMLEKNFKDELKILEDEGLDLVIADSNQGIELSPQITPSTTRDSSSISSLTGSSASIRESVVSSSPTTVRTSITPVPAAAVASLTLVPLTSSASSSATTSSSLKLTATTPVTKKSTSMTNGATAANMFRHQSQNSISTLGKSSIRTTSSTLTLSLSKASRTSTSSSISSTSLSNRPVSAVADKSFASKMSRRFSKIKLSGQNGS
ncbi:dedicator of cytokinesis-domain-containing protein [Lipomyces japonicus]|uniref:dedicator of cytokinesis-domain-containing protein n=1 Tax=Lipomyces japonicus TaxID=56871 RepID=UPI0034CECF53